MGAYLKDKPQELINAYKIFAFFRSTQIDHRHRISDIIFKLFQKHKEDFGGWWNASAKYVLPNYRTINDHYFEDSLKPQSKLKVKVIVEAAGQAWTDIANEWALIFCQNIWGLKVKIIKKKSQH